MTQERKSGEEKVLELENAIIVSCNDHLESIFPMISLCEVVVSVI